MAKNKNFSVSIKVGDTEKTLNFTEVSLPHEEWKALRASGDPEHLFLLGLGTKLRMQTLHRLSRFGTLILAGLLGIAVLLGFFVDVSAAIIVGVVSFLFFSLSIFSRFVRLEDTYSSILKALKHTPYREELDKFHENFSWIELLLLIPDFIIRMIPLVIDTFCILIENVFPRLVASRTNAVFAVPQGCGMDDIIALSDFYHETLEEKLEHAAEDLEAYGQAEIQQYMDEHTYKLNDPYDTILKPTGRNNYDSLKDRYEYIDQHGYIWYSNDNKSFYKKK
ncbi:MAG: hypothetical protein IJT69_01735 [Clostridia bacterium]|nr:hypothetical protein [Clostridia bacterium]